MALADRIAAISARAQRMNAAGAEDERRWALRKSSILAAYVISDRMQGSVPCVIRDMSATGARFTLQSQHSSVISSPSGLPQTFTMLLDREQIEVDCQLQWTTEREAGVRFLSHMRQLPLKARRVQSPNKR